MKKSTFVLVIVLPFLNACAPLLLAPLVGGLMPGDTKVSVDEATVSPELRVRLAATRRLAILGTDKSDTYIAEYLDRAGAFETELEPVPPGAAPSQRRRAMQEACAGKAKPDMVLSASSGESDAGAGTTIKGAMIGRTDFNVVGTIDMLACRDSWRTQFIVKVSVSQGLYNADMGKVNQVVGQEFGKVLIGLSGKSNQASGANGQPAGTIAQRMASTPVVERSTPPAAAPVQAIATRTPKDQTQDAPVAGTPLASKSALPAGAGDARPAPGREAIQGVQSALNALGFSVGTPDGSMGPRTKAAIVKFQTSKGLVANGELGPDTLAALGVQVNVRAAAKPDARTAARSTDL